MSWLAPAVMGYLIAFDQVVKLSLPAQHNNPHAPLIVIAIILSSCILLYRAKTSIYTKSALLLIISGGVSNLIDIIFIGNIRDIYSIYFFNLNFADLYIFVGSLITLITIFIPHSNASYHKDQALD